MLVNNQEYSYRFKPPITKSYAFNVVIITPRGRFSTENHVNT